jgi:DNA-cytosine methyltransferase
MLLAFARLVKELQPLWFVMENVPGLTHLNNRQLLADILKLFEETGAYNVAADVLLAADYGVPQFRYRLFIIGTRTGAPIRFPEPKLERGEVVYPTVRTAIFDLAMIKPIEFEKGESPMGVISGAKNHWCRKIGEIDRRRIAEVRAGHDWRDIPISLLPERYFMTRSSDQKGSYGRLDWDWPAYTVTNAALNVSAGAFTHPDQDRCLSVREVARIQSFPDNYEFAGSVESQYRQVGNAVPPNLSQAVAHAILYSHFNGSAAKNWGREGRLTYEVVANCLKGKGEFPTLTPRRVHPDNMRSTRHRPSALRPSSEASPMQPLSVWNLEPRPEDPWPEETRRLRKLAEQPKNIRAAKRAKAIVQFLDGAPQAEIVEKASVSEASVQKWIDGYFVGGLNGWRAFHSPFNRLASGDPKLQAKIERKIERVRKHLLVPRKEAGETDSPKRLHMNAYLQDLIGAFGEWSVDELMIKVEGALGVNVGTVYVGDLLAIADVILPRMEVAEKEGASLTISINSGLEDIPGEENLNVGHCYAEASLLSRAKDGFAE